MDMEKLVALCRRRGFIFQSSEIYGGINGFWDYGPLGVELKKNIKDAWWQDMVRNPPPGPDGQEIAMVGVDCSIIMNPKVWEASGHASGFADWMVDCKTCRKRFRADKVFLRAFAPERDQILQGIFANALVLCCEGDTKPEAEKLLGAEYERLVKKKKVPADLQASVVWTAQEIPSGLKRPCP